MEGGVREVWGWEEDSTGKDIYTHIVDSLDCIANTKATL